MADERIVIVAANNIRLSPYIRFYSKLLDEFGLKYDLIYPDRNGYKDEWDGTVYRIQWNPRIHSLINYRLFVKKAIRIIKTNKYKKLIILTSPIAVYMSHWLKKNYSDRYIIDIRDYSHENVGLYAFFEKVALQSAKYRIISSDNFKSFLPKLDYLVVHNMSYQEGLESNSWQKENSRITIGYVGAVAYEENIISLLQLVKNDDRFNFYIYGDGPNLKYIRSVVEKADTPRIRCFGAYKPDEKATIVKSIDILFNVYGNDSPKLRYALSNKLYDAMYYHKLVLNSPGTFMEEMCGICGYSIDYSTHSTLDDLYSWYHGLDADKVNLYQTNMNIRFANENKIIKEKISGFFSER